MNLSVNTLVAWGLETDTPVVERVIWIEADGTNCITIQCGSDRVLPSLRVCADIEEAVASNEARCLETDPYADFLLPDTEISASHARRRDEAWELIRPLLEVDVERLALLPDCRGPLIAARARETGHTKRVIYRALRRFWQGGMRRNALLPMFWNCGGKGKRRFENARTGKKRGRPNNTERATKKRTGVNVDADVARRLDLGVKEFLRTEDKRSVPEAYRLTMAKHFRGGFELRDGVLVPILLPAEQLPTLSQFRYWHETRQDVRQDITARVGKRRFNLSHREVLGESTHMAFGPGSLYQIDATIGDIYLKSSLDRTRIIGRPVIYLVIDVFSRLITGFSVGLEGPSWVGAMLAIDNATQNKVEFCAEYGLTITEAEWPSSCLPEAILGDRGELEGYAADNLVNGMNIRVANTPPYRADWKGIVERNFRLANDKLIRWLPGAVVKERERGGKDYRLDAQLTLHEFRTLMIQLVLEHNIHQRMDWYRFDEFMITDHVARYPIDLWNWGVRNRNGHLHSMAQDLVRIHLLPATVGSITHRGIKANGLLYTCNLAMREQWFVQARRKTRKVVVAYDPRTTSRVYLRMPDSKSVEECQLTDAEAMYLGKDVHEVLDYFDLETQARSGDALRLLQSKAELDARREHLVANAKAATAAANSTRGEQSKRSRIRNIRANRREERDQERRNGAWPVARLKLDPVAPQESAADEADSYVPPPSDIDRIRLIRKELWDTNE